MQSSKDSSIARTVFWIWIAINNLVAGTLLGITLLTGKAEWMPISEFYLRLATYVLIVSLTFSIITVGLVALFKRPGRLKNYSYLRIFLMQLTLLIVGYLLAYASVYINVLFKTSSLHISYSYYHYYNF